MGRLELPASRAGEAQRQKVIWLRATAESYAAKKTLVYCSEGSPSAFNPQVATDGTTFNNTRAIYNGLALATNSWPTASPCVRSSEP